MTKTHIRIGTRGSQLAQWQANWVADQLRQQPLLQQRGAIVELIEIATSGDVQQSGPIADVGLQGVFTKEVQAAVLFRLLCWRARQISPCTA